MIVTPIGFVISPFRKSTGTPKQTRFAEQACGRIEILPSYVAGLADLNGFSRVWLIYVFHRAKVVEITTASLPGSASRGVFATRSPSRPNRLGISCVKLLGVNENVVYVEGVDVFDGTPVLDIKPYVPEYDAYSD